VVDLGEEGGKQAVGGGDGEGVLDVRQQEITRNRCHYR
jgi:hypothetical protein